MDYKQEYKKLLEEHQWLLKKHSELQDEHIANLKNYIKIANLAVPLVKNYNETERFFKKYIIFSVFMLTIFAVVAIYYFTSIF